MKYKIIAGMATRGKTSLILLILLASFQVRLSLADQLKPNPPTPFQEMPYDNYTSTKDDNPHRSTHKFKQYLKDKYKEITEANSRVHHTAHGPSGDFFVMGDVVPLKTPDLSIATDKHTRARIIAKSFMEDEATLFGITKLDEIREVKIHDGKGRKGNYTIIYYRRYINNIELENSEIDIDIKDDDNINSFSARLVPVPPEVYEAAKKKTITEEDVRLIVESDLKENQIDLKEHPITFKKMATLSEPYVVWKASILWLYTIDAFTGKIISKYSLTKSGPNYPIKKDHQESVSPPMSPPVLPHK